MIKIPGKNRLTNNVLITTHILLGSLVVFALNGCGGGSGSASKEPIQTQTDNQTISQDENKSEDTVTIFDTPTVSEHWQLVWADEFDSPALNTDNWQHEINCFGGGNDEQQCYTDRLDNAFIEDDALVIQALKEEFTGPASHDDASDYNANITRTLPYTSARLRTKKLADWRYGRFEIRAKLPQGQGTWPAIWMLPTDWVYGGWAGSGEIDIMEAVNLKAQSDITGILTTTPENRVHGTLHFGKAWPENVYSGTSFQLPDNKNPADDFHTYAIEWQEGEIRWYVDGAHYATQRESGWYTQYHDDNGQLINSKSIVGQSAAPFDQQFHLILNFAVGGNWPSAVNEKGIDDSVFPQRLTIDYVRVYQCKLDSETGKGCAAIGSNAKLVLGHQVPDI